MRWEYKAGDLTGRNSKGFSKNLKDELTRKVWGEREGKRKRKRERERERGERERRQERRKLFQKEQHVLSPRAHDGY